MSLNSVRMSVLSVLLCSDKVDANDYCSTLSHLNVFYRNMNNEVLMS